MYIHSNFLNEQIFPEYQKAAGDPQKVKTEAQFAQKHNF
jgi:hypothetical protein